MCSYNKLEDDFQSEADPLRAYNDYLEDVENISKSYVSLMDTWLQMYTVVYLRYIFLTLLGFNIIVNK